jgi:hypothetical protein
VWMFDGIIVWRQILLCWRFVVCEDEFSWVETLLKVKLCGKFEV